MNDKTNDPAPAAGAGSIDTPEFRELLNDLWVAGSENNADCKGIERRIIAHIDQHVDAAVAEAEKRGADAERGRLVQTIKNANDNAQEAYRQRDAALAERSAAVTAGGGDKPYAWENGLTGEMTKDEETGFMWELNRYDVTRLYVAAQPHAQADDGAEWLKAGLREILACAKKIRSPYIAELARECLRDLGVTDPDEQPAATTQQAEGMQPRAEAEEDERAKFEGWLRRRWPNAVRPIDEKTARGFYVFSENNLLWDAWQARAALAQPQPVGSADGVPGADAALAVINYALSDKCYDYHDAILFLRYWNEGEFDKIRNNWRDVPEAVFIVADPLHPRTAQPVAEAAALADEELLKLASDALAASDARNGDPQAIAEGIAAIFNDEQDRRALETANAALIAAQPRDISPKGWERHEAAIRATFAALHKPAAAPTAQPTPFDPQNAGTVNTNAACSPDVDGKAQPTPHDDELAALVDVYSDAWAASFKAANPYDTVVKPDAETRAHMEAGVRAVLAALRQPTPQPVASVPAAVGELPPLPEPWGTMMGKYQERELEGFTADQMRGYATDYALALRQPQGDELRFSIEEIAGTCARVQLGILECNSLVVELRALAAKQAGKEGGAQ